MCGIVGYTGPKPAAPFLTEGLKRLSYRGYDSWGVTLQNGQGGFCVQKALGDVQQADLQWLVEKPHSSGLGHTRWATHGRVCLENTHPIFGPPIGGRGETLVSVVHNGIITNEADLRSRLLAEGAVFRTDTDTEVIAHVLARSYKQKHVRYVPDLKDVLQEACAELEGDYAFAAMLDRWPGYILAVSHGAPLLYSKDGYVASDIAALAGFTKQARRLGHGDWAILWHGDSWSCGKNRWEEVSEAPAQHTGPAMLREIIEQPQLVRQLPPWPTYKEVDYKRFLLFGCGSSYHAAMLGRRYLEIAGRPAQAEYATEMPPLSNQDGTLYVALSQSGETRDTVAALRRLPTADSLVLTSNLLSEATLWATAIDLCCGHEEGVAATKTFTAQVLRLYQLAHAVSGQTHVDWLQELAQDMETVLASSGQVANLAKILAPYHHLLYLGRGLMYPIAKEGALKMKEVAYRHAEAMPAAEVKHGPIALIDECVATVVVAMYDDLHQVEQIIGNIREIRARGGLVVAIADEKIGAVFTQERLVDHCVLFPAQETYLLRPLVANLVLQLLSYHMAVLDGLNVDRPRNLAKCVTV